MNAIAEGVPGVTDLIFAPSGALLACQPELQRVVAFDAAGRMSIDLDEIDAHSVAVAANGAAVGVSPMRPATGSGSSRPRAPGASWPAKSGHPAACG